MEHPFNVVLYGGDYNPEQWPKEIWKEDLRLFDLAGINSATVNVFSWAKLQSSEEEYNFAELDEIIDTLSKANVQIVLATSTACHARLAGAQVPRGRPGWITRAAGISSAAGTTPAPTALVFQHYAREAGAPAGGALRQQSSRGVLARQQRVRRSLLLRELRKGFPGLAAEALRHTGCR